MSAAPTVDLSPRLVSHPALIPVSVIIPVKNEARNLPRCLESLRNFADVHVIDSGSTDETCNIAESYGAEVVQFRYRGGWPKKRQWAMDNLSLACDWLLLLDADEVMTEELEQEIHAAIQSKQCNGYFVALQMHFMGRRLRHSDAKFWKLSLFRRGHAHYECRLKDQDASMADMEVHEHVVCAGSVGRLRNPLTHRNVESLERFIQKHNEYSNWEARVWANSAEDVGIKPVFWGTQAQRRRWLRQKFLFVPGFPIMFFVYKYFFRLGLLDGIPGLIYCGMQSVQFFHIKAKIYELKLKQKRQHGASA